MTRYQTKETTEVGVQHWSIYFRQTMERFLNKPSFLWTPLYGSYLVNGGG
jgi:hypothetical protein